MHDPQFLPSLLAFLGTLSGAEGVPLEADTELIDAGVIDSFSIMQLLEFLETRLGVSVPLEELDLDTVRTPVEIDRVFNRPAASP